MYNICIVPHSVLLLHHLFRIFGLNHCILEWPFLRKVTVIWCYEMYISSYLCVLLSMVTAVKVPNKMFPFFGQGKNTGGEAGLRGEINLNFKFQNYILLLILLTGIILFTLPLWFRQLTFYYVMCLLFLLLFFFTYYYFLYIRPKLATTHPTNEVRMLDKKIEDIKSVDKDLATNGLTLDTHTLDYHHPWQMQQVL